MKIAHAVHRLWKDVLVDANDEIRGAHREPATEAALDAFEKAHGVTLPKAFRALYLLSDGTGVMDGHEQIFWPIQAIANVMRTFDPEDPKAIWIGFADFRLRSVVFFLRVDRATKEIDVWSDRTKRIASSFDEMLERYVESPLFWKKPPKRKKRKARS